MIQDKDIDIIYDDQEFCLEVIAKLELTQTYRLDNNITFGYKHRADCIKAAEKHCKASIKNKLYGDLRQKIKETYAETMQLVGYNPYSKYEDLEKLRKMFGELLDMTKIDENKVESEQN